MKATIQYIKKELSGLYPETEIKAFTRIILEHVCGLDYTAQSLMRENTIDPRCNGLISEIVNRLKTFEPIQYIFGETEFFGMKLKVNPAVLIPRPETEELVQWIAESELPRPSTVLDIGTGSGCIALALKKELPQARVSGVDFSEEALQIANGNASLNQLEVDFSRADILQWESTKWESCDVIVSNPPYVRESEKEAMFTNVLKYEPEKALFVSDSDPLLFYRRIAEFARQFLNKNGWLFFEINEKFGEEMKRLVSESGFHAIEIRKDLFGKDRMLRCRR